MLDIVLNLLHFALNVLHLVGFRPKFVTHWGRIVPFLLHICSRFGLFLCYWRRFLLKINGFKPEFVLNLLLFVLKVLHFAAFDLCLICCSESVTHRAKSVLNLLHFAAKKGYVADWSRFGVILTSELLCFFIYSFQLNTTTNFVFGVFLF